MDRGYTVFSSWSPYAASLGAKSARLQAGWAKCDPWANGTYEWAWLDEAVSGLLAVGIQPWLQTSFGNSVYPGGGSPAVGSPLPNSTAALAGWDAWVTALVHRYAPQGINVWEVWNEPNAQRIDANEYATFTLRTAALIRAVQPQAVIRFGVVAGVDVSYGSVVAKHIAAVPGGAALVDEFTYHPYVYNPDSAYSSVSELQQAVQSVLPLVKLSQGENGAPSVGGGYGALVDYNWTECCQAKYFARRLVRDNSLGIFSSAFSMVDLCYEGSDGKIDVNHKGLLLADCYTPGYPVVRPKVAYSVVQHIAAVFDATLLHFKGRYSGSSINFTAVDAMTGAAPPFSTAQGLWASATGQLLLAVWNSSGTPVDAGEIANSYLNITVSISGAPLPNPATVAWGYVDLAQGMVYTPPVGTARGSTGAGGATTSLHFDMVPIQDYPTLVADTSLLHLA